MVEWLARIFLGVLERKKNNCNNIIGIMKSHDFGKADMTFLLPIPPPSTVTFCSVNTPYKFLHAVVNLFSAR